MYSEEKGLIDTPVSKEKLQKKWTNAKYYARSKASAIKAHHKVSTKGLGFLNPTSHLAFVCGKEAKRMGNEIGERGGATLV